MKTASTASTLVVCVGDSITRGQVSADYVDRLARRWGPDGYRFVNAGVNGDLAYNVAERIDEVVRHRPDIVTLLVGTNDVNARFDARWLARYRKNQRLPVDPSVDWYGAQIDRVLTRLTSETDARVIVLDIPPLGEDLHSRMNGLVRDHNVRLREVAAAHRIACLPLYDRLVAALPPDHEPQPYTGDVGLIAKAAMQHRILRRSWDAIATRNGLVLLTDHVHLADRAADIVADLIGEHLEPPRA